MALEVRKRKTLAELRLDIPFRRKAPVCCFQTALLAAVGKKRVRCGGKIPEAVPQKRATVLQQDSLRPVNEHDGDGTVQKPVASVALVPWRVANRSIGLVNEDQCLVH